MHAPDAIAQPVRPSGPLQGRTSAAEAIAGEPAGRRSPRVAATDAAQRDSHVNESMVGVRIGSVVEVLEDSMPLVDFPGNVSGRPVAARTTVRLEPQDVRRNVVLMFEDGSPRHPVILGLLEPGPEAPAEATPPESDLPSQDAPSVLDPGPFTVEADGQRVTVAAHEELVLRCGKASITLTKAGKVIVRGAYLLSRSSGVNRIKGGSVQIN